MLTELTETDKQVNPEIRDELLDRSIVLYKESVNSTKEGHLRELYDQIQEKPKSLAAEAFEVSQYIFSVHPRG